MPRVRVLSPTLINKIAAGEVVVRPASVVKELVENSLDAGAKFISVEITNGCRDILVVDDGCGMAREDAELALVRHATSKIERVEDLNNVRTAGFRGEAVPSIAAVSRLTITTRPADELAGTQLRIEGGTEPEITVAAASPGTRIDVRDLFFNVPARRKFLKSSAAELNATLQIMTRLALAYPAVGYEVVYNGRKRLDLTATESLERRIVDLLGERYRDKLYAVEGNWEATPALDDVDGVNDSDASDTPRVYTVSGFLAHPELAAKDRTRQYFFANGRPITHRRLGYVLGEACRGFVMTQRFPVAVLRIEAPEGDLDVNVHPTKEEVRFAREDKIGSIVFHAIRATLGKANLTPRALHDRRAEEGSPASRPSVMTSAERSQSDFLGVREAAPSTTRRVLSDDELQSFRDVWFGDSRAAPPPPADSQSIERNHSGDYNGSVPEEPSEYVGDDHVDTDNHQDQEKRSVDIGEGLPQLSEDASDEELLEREFLGSAPPRVLGQIARSFIMAESGDDVMIIDQHAAHERLLYQYFLERDRQGGQQPLFVPIVIDLPATLAVLLDDLIAPLAKLGFEIESFGGNSYQISALPHDLPEIDVAALLVDLLEDLQREGTPRELDARHHRMASMLACKAAVKANHTLSREEMQRLLADLHGARLPYTCPHGRPTMILLTRYDLEHLFKRH